MLTILLIVDTPLIIAASAYGVNRLSLDLLLIEGIAEMAAVTLAMVPLPFTGTKDTASDKAAIIPRMASVMMVLSGAVFYFVGICLAFVWSEDWTGFWLLLTAVGWSAFSYFRLMRTADVNASKGAWTGAAISAPVFIGFFVAVFYGIYKGATS